MSRREQVRRLSALVLAAPRGGPAPVPAGKRTGKPAGPATGARPAVPFLDRSAGTKSQGESQDPASTGRERSVIRASSAAARASAADRYSAARNPSWNAV